MAIGCLVVVVVFAGREALLALTGRAEPTIDSQRVLEEMVWAGFPGVDRSENRWELFERAGGMLRRAREAGNNVLAPDGNPPEWDWRVAYASGDELEMWVQSAPSQEEAGAWRDAIIGAARAAMESARQEGAYELVAGIARAPALVRPAGEGRVYWMEINELTTVRVITRLQIARLHDAAGAGDEDGGTLILRDTLAILSAVSRQATMGDRRCADDMLREVLAHLRRMARERRLSAPAMRDAIEALSDLSFEPLTSATERARVAALDLVQWTYSGEHWWGGGRCMVSELEDLTDQSRDWGRASPDPGVLQRLSNVRSLVLPTKEQANAEVNRYFDDVAAAAALGAGERTRAFEEIDAAHGETGVPAVYWRLTLPRMPMLVMNEDRRELELAATVLVLAIETWRAEHGRLPASLDDLVPGLLASLPRDPFSSEGKFGYRVGDGPGHGADGGFVLYSFGPDRTDNGGRINPRDPGRESWWMHEGYDFVLSGD